MEVILNKKIKMLWAVLFFLISAPYSFSQSKKEIRELEINAKENFDDYRFHLALPMYLALSKLQPEDVLYKYYIAYCYIHVDNETKALPYFEECLKSPQKLPMALNYYAARAFHLSGRYEEAKKHFEIFKEDLEKNKKKNRGTIEDVQREIDMCVTAQELTSKPLDIKLVNLGPPINTEYAEYAPVLSADQTTLIFTSTRPNTTGGKVDDSDGNYYEDIYISYKPDSLWSPPVSMGSAINTNGHDASIALSADGQKLLLYRYSPDNLSASTSGDLFISELYGNQWNPAVQLPDNINSTGWEASATFSPHEKTMFFASDRPGGYGGTDIYSVKKLPHGEWALPQNMGPAINTAYDEDSPYMHPDGKSLYFSSNGHKTMGGYDIFVSTAIENEKNWSIPHNVGYPINTPHDDLHFSWSADGRRVYFSSIRPGGYGDRDIYYADIQKEASDVMIMKGLVIDSLTKKPVLARLYVLDRLTNEITEIFKSNSITGKYLVLFTEGRNYRFSVEAEGYEDYEEEINIENLHEFEEKIKNILMSPVLNK